MTAPSWQSSGQDLARSRTTGESWPGGSGEVPGPVPGVVPGARQPAGRSTGANLQAMSLLEGVAHFAVRGRTLLQGPAPDSLAAHQARYGARPGARGWQGQHLLDAITAAELTGRGGAGFPVARKWQTARDSTGAVIVVANGAESEALSAKDTTLLLLRPHLVLDGLISAAEALDAENAIIWLHESATAVYAAVVQAMQERQAAGLDDLAVHVSWGPDSYLTGESSAIVQGLEGRTALPTFTREPAARNGIQGRPTVIHNAETLARIALIARHGASAPQPGPLLTVASGGTLTVCELPDTTTVGQVVLPVTTAWTSEQAPQAILIGGYGGRWARWSDVAGLQLRELDGRHPATAGSRMVTRRRAAPTAAARPSLSTGILAAIPPGSCGIAETAAIADYLARSSARQCGPCLFGTRALADGMLRIAAGSGRRGDAERLRRTTHEVEGRGACGMPDGAAHLVRSALHVFGADLDRHVRRRGCGHIQGHTVLHVPDLPPDAG